MAEIGGKRREPLFDVDPVAIPAEKRPNGEAMPEVVQPRAMTGADRTQAHASRQGVEREMNLATVEPVTTARDVYFKLMCLTCMEKETSL